MKIISLIFICSMLVSCGRGDGKHMPLDKSNPKTTTSSSQPPAGSSNNPSAPQASTQTASAGPTYQKDILPIFTKNCSSCHNARSGLPNWLDYQVAFGKKDRIMERDVVKRTMPPPGMPPLQESEVATIKKWLESGAPEGASAVASNQPAVTTMSTAQTSTIILPTGPAEPVEEAQAPTHTVSCAEYGVYPTGKLKSNDILDATVIGENISTVTSVNLFFDSEERIKEVEGENFLRPNLNDPGKIEVCGAFIDKGQCKFVNKISDTQNAVFDIRCQVPTVHFYLVVKDGAAQIMCKTRSKELRAHYNRCQIK
jgi:mono/diheme cytochrome c family protein